MLDPISITTTFVGLGGLGAVGLMVRRVLTKQDSHSADNGLLKTDVEVLKSKMPNGDWAEIKNDLLVMRRVNKKSHDELKASIEESRGKK